MTRCNWSAVVSVYRDQEVAKSNFHRSPGLATAAEVLCQSGYPTVSAAYNAALDAAQSDVVVFVHPDVFLPDSWGESLENSLLWLQKNDPTWGVAGLFGCQSDGRVRGYTFSSGRGCLIGAPFASPEPVKTLDEFVFMVRRSSGLRFDEQLPGSQSQLCATDICLEAKARGSGVYVLPAFALHNSNGWSYLPMPFWRPYLYVRRKWRHELPIAVPYTYITRACVPMIKNSIRGLIARARGGHRRTTRRPDVIELYNEVVGKAVAPSVPAGGVASATVGGK